MQTKLTKWYESEIVLNITLIPFFALFLSGIGIICYQLYFYAKNGNWVNVSIVDLMEFPSLQNNWIGIHKILVWMPASLTLLICSALYIFLIANLVDELKN